MNTPERILVAALKLFAERGFYGASMDQIAGELGLTKQALIHHFGTKEKLYGAVLVDISGRLIPGVFQTQDAGSERSFTDAVLYIYQSTLEHREDVLVLMRELLDNRDRAAKAGNWYLRPFLDGLANLLRRDPSWSDANDASIFVHVYQVLGAINYFAVSTVTLGNMYSTQHVEAMRESFPELLQKLATGRERGR
ncbi:HTH-type transcriptional repressor NicS [Zhongshania aliphaticivorans]|uniref:HTH-type transcriptional repressor NicS n=1 Tax=Zhongshania aliphaticivorans TaxID=1470434 RepID=A0A5S9MT25_9GAMM|nr:TetR/AcrR family transcriptional regulator [Zhongshania aliphaticivorans]CAA0080201.1 HTH-type transcriptional repressor NicS [Zhongshania aliphaticivorans]CAA0085788.1 HTH-type transcriptional repressor NicS [Zhongshania aliphaticivorans]